MNEIALHDAITANPWASLVFHVLAHIPPVGVPADLFSAEYVQYVASTVGPASSRPLGEDAAALASSVRSHETLAQLQHVAWLFEDLAEAQAAALTDLSALAGEGARMASSRALGPVMSAAELLRASALLEAPIHAALPVPRWDRAALAAELGRACTIAPRLATAPVHVVPALTEHGRVYDREIWIGVPAETFQVSVEHVALQAAHESTVLEVNEAAALQRTPLTERAGEAVAVVVFAQRAAAEGRADDHRLWGERFGLGPEHFSLDVLPPSSAALASQLLSKQCAP